MRSGFWTEVILALINLGTSTGLDPANGAREPGRLACCGHVACYCVSLAGFNRANRHHAIVPARVRPLSSIGKNRLNWPAYHLLFGRHQMIVSWNWLKDYVPLAMPREEFERRL